MFNYLTKLPFLKRLIPSITTRYYKLSKGNKNFFKVGNIKFYLDYLDPLDRKMIIYQKYEDDQVRYLEDQMNKVTFSNFIDIGANSAIIRFILLINSIIFRLKHLNLTLMHLINLRKHFQKIHLKMLKFLILAYLIKTGKLK